MKTIINRHPLLFGFIIGTPFSIGFFYFIVPFLIQYIKAHLG